MVPVTCNTPANYLLLMHGAADKRQQCYLTGLFYRQRELALVFCACSCNSSGHDLSPFSDELSQSFRVFVVEFKRIVYTESTDFFSLEKSVFTASFLISIHDISPSISPALLWFRRILQPLFQQLLLFPVLPPAPRQLLQLPGHRQLLFQGIQQLHHRKEGWS